MLLLRFLQARALEKYYSMARRVRCQVAHSTSSSAGIRSSIRWRDGQQIRNTADPLARHRLLRPSWRCCRPGRWRRTPRRFVGGYHEGRHHVGRGGRRVGGRRRGRWRCGVQARELVHGAEHAVEPEHEQAGRDRREERSRQVLDDMKKARKPERSQASPRRCRCAGASVAQTACRKGISCRTRPVYSAEPRRPRNPASLCQRFPIFR